MADCIPVIDFSLYGLQVQDKNSVTVDDLQNLDNEIYSAFKDIGFCYLKNHGFSTELVKKVRKVTREFFEQPEDVKSQYARKVETNNGWVAVGRESLNPERPGDYKEAYNYSPSEMGQKSPEFLPDFLSLNKEFFTMAMRLTDRILDVLSMGLKLEDRDFLTKCHGLMGEPGNYTTLRSLFYPPLPTSIKKDQVRCGEHSDYGTVTLLFQDEVGGLEVQTREGVYVEAPYLPDTILVNTGDLLQRWTGDKLVAAKHRVMIPDDDSKKKQCRQSFAFFVHPDDNVMIKCLDGSDKYEPISSIDYLDMRFSMTY